MILLFNSRVDPDLSAYTYLFGPYDFNKFTMANPGTRVIVHNKPGKRTSWDHNDTPSCYIGSSFDQYSCMQWYMPLSSIIIITDTIQYILMEFHFPRTTTEEYLQETIGYIIKMMKYMKFPKKGEL